MTYFDKAELPEARKKRNLYLIIYLLCALAYVVLTVGCFLWYASLPYGSKTTGTIKLIHYAVSFLFVVFSFIYMYIVFKGANRYYKLVKNLSQGIKETSTAQFIGYSHQIQDKDGVEMRALLFKEWNKYKNEFYERKVLVFADRDFPEIEEDAFVSFVTQGNVLISYQIQERIKE